MDFILSAEDHDLVCSVLQARITVDEPGKLIALIPGAKGDDPHIWNRSYRLTGNEWRRLVGSLDIRFDTAGLEDRHITVCLWRCRGIEQVPYLVHTGYELLLLIDGRKKLARMGGEYPPESFAGEERFDYWVERGVLSKIVVSEPFDKPIRQWLGHRTVYYTLKGEEWRVPAMRLLSPTSGKSGGWNEYYERLEGTLFGYSDDQNDWWVNTGLQNRGFGGAEICCGVTLEGLAWIEATGYRALPPAEAKYLKMSAYWPETEAAVRSYYLDDLKYDALVRCNVLGRHIMNIVDLRTAGPWDVPADKIPFFNRHIRGSVVVVALRGEDRLQRDRGSNTA